MGPRDDGSYLAGPGDTPGGSRPVPAGPPPGAHRRPPRRRRDVLALAAVAVLVLALAEARLTRGGGVGEGRDVAVTSADGAGTYRFLLTRDDGSPVRWDPCTPIRYVVDVDDAPHATALRDVRTALSRASERSGLTFAFAGEPEDALRPDREPVVRDGTGRETWAPVLIAWADAAEVPSLAGDVVGSALTVPAGDRPVYVTGAIYLDTAHDLLPGFGTARSWGTILLHEVGHLVGLGHVDDEGEIMHPGGERSGVAATVRWGPGDRAGLAAIGLGAGCERAPAPSAAAVR